MSIIRDYDNFILPADNLEKAKDFYQQHLGLEIKFDFADKGMVAFKVGDSEPAVILRKGDDVKPSIVFEVDDVKTAYKELKQKGVSFSGEPFEIATGLMASFTDPFGNRLAITDYSKMPALREKKK